MQQVTKSRRQNKQKHRYCEKKAGYTKGESVVGESPTLVPTANGGAKRRYKAWGSSKHREQFLVHACYYHEKSNSEEAGGSSSSVELTMF